MGVCANYEMSMDVIKDLSARATLSSGHKLLSYTPPSTPWNSTNGTADKQAEKKTYDKDQCTSGVNPGQIGPRNLPYEVIERSVDTHLPSPPLPDETALNQQLGVRSITTRPPAAEPYSKRPKWRVTQSTDSHVFTRPTTGPLDEHPKATTEESTAVKAALRTSAATSKGYGLLIPPKRSAPSIYRNKACNAVFGVDDQRPRTTPVPLPPLPPAMMDPLLPPEASQQQKLQYAMMMHNHSILNRGKG